MVLTGTSQRTCGASRKICGTNGRICGTGRCDHSSAIWNNHPGAHGLCVRSTYCY
jgi:hypothetical protein